MTPGSTPWGRIVRIDRGAIHDGPGVRTVIVFKGCPLLCAWCHSPETQGAAPELLVYEDRCIGCGTCLEVCQSGAAQLTNGRAVVDRNRCAVCGRCTEVCPTGAHDLSSTTRSLDDVMREVLKDRAFFDLSGGGITLSGGEPLMQPAFALAVLDRCRRERVHTVIETCGLVRRDVLMRAAHLADLFLFDVKLIDDARHREATRASNRRILDNLHALALVRRDIVVRFPLIPGVNDDADNVAATGERVAALGLSRIDLLRYHRAGIAKYARLGRRCTVGHIEPPSDAAVTAAAETLRRFGLDVHVGGSS